MSEHGDFVTTPVLFLLSKHGCPKCKNNKTSIRNHELKSDSLLDFMNKANIIHNNKYNYDKVNYINSRTKVIITCPIHGDFEQLPSHHIQGCGCPSCKNSKGELLVESILKELNIQYETLFKVDSDFLIFYIDFKIGNKFIEYHGELHFKPISIFGDNDYFQELVLRDYNLRLYCFINDIPLLEIPYYLSSEQIKKNIIKFNEK